MNTLTKKFTISVLSIVFVITLLGTVTYAWFSLSTANVLDSLSLNITTGDELQISLDGVNYYREIESSMIREKVGENLILQAVTSTDGENFKLGGPKGEDIPIENEDYLNLTFWFRTSDAQRNIYLAENVSDIAEYDEGKDGTYVVSRGIVWKADRTFQYGENEIVNDGDKDIYYAADAVRISFLEEKIVENENDTRRLDVLSKKIFDLSENNSRGYGSLFGGLDYYNIKWDTNITPPTYKPSTFYSLSEFDEYIPFIPLDDNSHILELIKTNSVDENNRSYYVGKVSINIWLEGWDADCFDAIFSDSIKVQLKFKAGLPTMTSSQMSQNGN